MTSSQKNDDGSKGRDPFLDALRAGALLVVVLGHWVATLPLTEDNRVVGTEHILEMWGPAAFFTWLVQVVPLFVFVSAAVSSGGVERRLNAGHPHLHWWADRALGLARPTVTYLVVLVAVTLTALYTGARLLEPLNHSLTVHLWFLLTLLGVQALLGLSHRADRRWGLKAVVGLIVIAAAIDLLRAWPTSPGALLQLGSLVTEQHDLFGWLNAIVIWLVPQQLGIAWWRGRFGGRRAGLGFLLLGVAWLGGAVALGYPVGMVNGEIGGDTNLLPPTLALLGVIWLQIGVVLTFEAPVRRFLERRRTERLMAMFGALGLQLYLWHKLAELPAIWLGERLGIGMDAAMPGEAGFWLARLEWIALCGLAVTPVIIAVVFFERRRKKEVAHAVDTKAILAGGAALIAGLGISLALGAFPGAIFGLVGVAAASYLLRARTT